MQHYSAEWLDAMAKEDAFRTAIAAYQMNTDTDTIKKDILTAFQHNSIVDGVAVFDNRHSDLIVTRLMSEGYFRSHIIELVWRELVGLVFRGRDEAAHSQAESQAILIFLLGIIKNEFCHFHAVFRLLAIFKAIQRFDRPMRLLYEMGFKKELLAYIEKYKACMELNDEELEDWRAMGEITMTIVQLNLRGRMAYGIHCLLAYIRKYDIDITLYEREIELLSQYTSAENLADWDTKTKKAIYEKFPDNKVYQELVPVMLDKLYWIGASELYGHPSDCIESEKLLNDIQGILTVNNVMLPEISGYFDCILNNPISPDDYFGFPFTLKWN